MYKMVRTVAVVFSILMLFEFPSFVRSRTQFQSGTDQSISKQFHIVGFFSACPNDHDPQNSTSAAEFNLKSQRLKDDFRNDLRHMITNNFIPHSVCNDTTVG